jgi:pimeloyl-ACP methyl ester carboxylesterase
VTDFATSADGTRIAYERLGSGPPVVLVSGMFCTRDSTRDLAIALSARCDVLHYDRRGRGESGDTPPYAVERELDDLAAVLAATGGAASVYGHSSGAGLALRAAAAGLPIDRLVLHEPPYGDADGADGARHLAAAVRTALAEDRRADAIGLFLAEMGLPADVLAGMQQDPAMLAVAPTMTNDFEVMGDFEGGTIPEGLAGQVDRPTLVVAGTASPPFFVETAERLAELVPGARLALLEGHDHGAPAEVVGPVVADFVAGA